MKDVGKHMPRSIRKKAYSTDILMSRAELVPVNKDNEAHVEATRVRVESNREESRGEQG
jgi:Tryptophanyl-tRNA synthetase